jgi:hypothetical protein
MGEIMEASRQASPDAGGLLPSICASESMRAATS